MATKKTPARDAFRSRVKNELKEHLQAVQNENVKVRLLRTEVDVPRVERLDAPSSFDGIRTQYRTALHQHETMKRRMKTAKKRIEDSEWDLRNAATNVPFDAGAMTELGAELAKRILSREEVERDLKRTRANLRSATESYVTFEEEDKERAL